MKRNYLLRISTIILLLAVSTSTTLAQGGAAEKPKATSTTPKKNIPPRKPAQPTRISYPEESTNTAEMSKRAAKIFEQAIAQADNSAPKELIDKTKAIAIFPEVTVKATVLEHKIIGSKNALIIHSGAEGLITRHIGDRWSIPALYLLEGSKFSAKFGGSPTSLILFFINDSATNGLLKDKFELDDTTKIVSYPMPEGCLRNSL